MRPSPNGDDPIRIRAQEVIDRALPGWTIVDDRVFGESSEPDGESASFEEIRKRLGQSEDVPTPGEQDLQIQSYFIRPAESPEITPITLLFSAVEDKIVGLEA